MGMFGDLLERISGGASGLLSDGQWRTLSNGRRVKIDGGGRVVAGLPAEFHGVHVRDLPALFKRQRELKRTDCAAKCHKCPSTWKDKNQAVAAVLTANPELRQLLDSDGGAGSKAYRAWLAHGRRGKKPELARHDGRFDTLNERWNLRGFRRVGSWLEALYTTIPTSRRWLDLGERLDVLGEATGLELHLPSEALRLQVSRLDSAECKEQVERALDLLFHVATTGRLEATTDAVPF